MAKRKRRRRKSYSEKSGEEIFSPREAGDYCQVDRTTILGWIKKKGLPATRTPGGYFKIHKKDLDRFLNKFDIFRQQSLAKRDQPLVLIVDDEEEMLLSLSAALEERYEVLTTPSGKEALSVLHEKQIDLVILDIMMPEMDGYEMIRQMQINRGTMHIPVIMVTAKVMEEDAVKGFESGAVDYIRKPYGVPELIRRIDNALKR